MGVQLFYALIFRELGCHFVLELFLEDTLFGKAGSFGCLCECGGFLQVYFLLLLLFSVFSLLVSCTLFGLELA